METTELSVAAQRHTDAVFSLTFTASVASSAPKGGRKQGGDEGFSVPRGKNGGFKDAGEWPTWSTLLHFKCFFKWSICCVTLNSRVWPEPRCLRQGATHYFTSWFRALVLMLGCFTHY